MSEVGEWRTMATRMIDKNASLRARVAELERELAACRPRHYTPDELGRDLGQLERQIEQEGGS